MFLLQTCSSLFYNSFRNCSVKTTLILVLILIPFSTDRDEPAVVKGQRSVAYRDWDLKISWLHASVMVLELGKSISCYVKLICPSDTISFWIAEKPVKFIFLTVKEVIKWTWNADRQVQLSAHQPLFCALCAVSWGKTLSKVTAALENSSFYPPKARHVQQVFPKPRAASLFGNPRWSWSSQMSRIRPFLKSALSFLSLLFKMRIRWDF